MTSTTNTLPCPGFDHSQVLIRSAGGNDCSALLSLFRESVLEGQVRHDDTGEDISNLLQVYFADEGRSGFWVATFTDQVIGMVGVRNTSADVAEIRRLRVRNDYRRRGVGSRLMEQAVSFCKRLGYLKVVLDVRVERGPAISLFEKFGFTHGRSRDHDGLTLLDFYMNIYNEPHH